MTNDRLHEALDLVFQTHEGRTWPGSQIPLAAHPLEVACRVAAWGGTEMEILAALLHDLPEVMEPGPALQIARLLGQDVQECLEKAWATQEMLPQAGSFPWFVPAETDPDLRKILACDALCHLRSLVRDWEALATTWEYHRDPVRWGTCYTVSKTTGVLSQSEVDRLLLTQCGVKPAISPSLLPAVVDRQTLRLELITRYRQWMTLPWSNGTPPFEAFRLANPARSLDADLESWREVLTSWNFPSLAREMQGWGKRLGQKVKVAWDGFLLNHALDPMTYHHSDAVAACLRYMNLSDLAVVLINSPIEAFRAHVPKHLQKSSLRYADLHFTSRDNFYWHMALVKALETCVNEKDLKLPSRLWPAPPTPDPSPAIGPRLSQALHAAIDSHAQFHWPLTRIPYLFHAMEVLSLALQEGCDAPRTLAAFHAALQSGNGSPEDPAPQAVLEAFPLAKACVDVSLQRFLVADYASMDPSEGGDPNDLRQELHALLPTFRAIFSGTKESPLDALLIKNRFGAIRLLDFKPKNPWTPLLSEIGSLNDLLRDLQRTLEWLLHQPEDYAQMNVWGIQEIIKRVSKQALAMSAKDPAWQPHLEVFLLNVSRRGAELLREEIAMLPDDLVQARKAQGEIAEVVAQLRQEGVIR